VADKLVLTVSEVAKILRLSRNSAYQGVLRGEIPSIRVGKRILVPRRALEALLDGAKEKAGPGESVV
jgi:excisionase family DNA binding protein